jgi:flagellar L-ring protein precursor FlgH
MRRGTLLLASLALLPGGCAIAQRLGDGAGPPRMTASADPTKAPGYRPVSLPMPPQPTGALAGNSLWHPGSRAFFPDQRAAHVGDIVTVVVNMADAASLTDNTTATRTANQGMNVSSLFGIVRPSGGSSSSGPGQVSSTNADGNTGTGTLTRNETVTLRLAGVVTQELPNGNLAVVARQEFRVNSELRELVVSGVVRPQDIASDNTVPHDRMAEARISYGGRGVLTDVQSPHWGQQFLDQLLPF